MMLRGSVEILRSHKVLLRGNGLFKTGTFLFGMFCLFILISYPAPLAAFTMEEERKLGREIYEKFEKGQHLLQEKRVKSFVTRLGEKLLEHSDRAPFDFTFSVVRSSAVNAFATPGGYIYLNQGLINLCENEAELAGVLAHEIAHINGRHIAENISRSQKINLSTLAAILAGALLGGGGELSAAVTGFSMATATSLSLKYSREQEEAADRMGLTYLVAAGFDGKAMLGFLKSIRKHEYYSNAVPSYLLTHPVSEERIRYLDGLLETQYKGDGAKEMIGGFGRIQTQLWVENRPNNANLPYFQKRVSENPKDADMRYGLAVTQERLGMITEAIENYRTGLTLSPDDRDMLRGLGMAYFKSGQTQEAVLTLRRAVSVDPLDEQALLFFGRSLEAQGELREALQVYHKVEEKNPGHEDVLYHLAMVYGKAGRRADSHYYFGRFYKLKGRKDTALHHFQSALKLLPIDAGRSREIRKEIEELVRR